MFNEIENLDDDCQVLLDLLNHKEDSSLSQKANLINHIYLKDTESQHQLLRILLIRYRDYEIDIDGTDGMIFELLLQSDIPAVRAEVAKYFKEGIVQLNSDCGIDYLPLQKLLLAKRFQEADTLTHALLCNLSQVLGDHTRQWLYFTDIGKLPAVDLHTIDKLWLVHSGGLFGLSVQKQIWLSANSNWEKFWSKIGWKVNNVNCRYPQEFVWDVSAPAGHLPLFNQLRGVQVLAALFNHPAFL
uniref:GUN4-like domain-containing protein n=1 Tax=Izziella formosana TaxID=1653389 RepID=A0A1G4NUT6_9FLOR|nr:Hypothetical protein ycf53 [Izziella formosana]SCW22286.1 Hypothetical protein ycf53 [Izziella formosana]